MATNINQAQDVVLNPTCPYCEADLTTFVPRSWRVDEGGRIELILCTSCMKVLGILPSK